MNCPLVWTVHPHRARSRCQTDRQFNARRRGLRGFTPQLPVVVDRIAALGTDVMIGPMKTIDLNSDLGESFGAWTMGDDPALLAIVTSANIACGFHAGDPGVLRRTCTEAAAAGVAIGAHVSYRDLVGFGRRFLDVHPTELADDVTYQLGALDAFARQAGTQVRYVKPHGALYNTVVSHEQQAGAVVDAVCAYGGDLAVLTLPRSALGRIAAAAGLRVVTEAFADRGYAADGTLVPRTQLGAVLHDPDQVAARMVELVTTGQIAAVDGSRLTIEAESICVHGDSPGAVAMARAVASALTSAGVTLRAFT